jgi:hypothetical protein
MRLYVLVRACCPTSGDVARRLLDRLAAAHSRLSWLQRSDLGGLQALGSLFDSELDPLAFVQGAEPPSLDGRIMDEYVLSDLTGDEAIPLARVEPFDGSGFFFGHFPYSLICVFLGEAVPAEKKDRPVSASLGGL